MEGGGSAVSREKSDDIFIDPTDFDDVLLLSNYSFSGRQEMPDRARSGLMTLFMIVCLSVRTVKHLLSFFRS